MTQSYAAATKGALVLFFISCLTCTSGQWMRGPGELLFRNLASDYMYRFRVAVTPLNNFVYAIDGASGGLTKFTAKRSERGIPTAEWLTKPIPGLLEKQPVINVDISTDRAYFIHPGDGRLYCFDASKGTGPVWISSFVCTSPDDVRNQQHQAFTANGKRLLARCNDSIVMLNGKGELLKVFASSNVQTFVATSDLSAPIPVFSNFTKMITWYTTNDPLTGASSSFLEVWGLGDRNTEPAAAKDTYALPAGVVPSGVNSDSIWWTVVVDSMAPVVYVLSSFTGVVQSSYDFQPLVNPTGEYETSVLPSPIIANGVMYGIVQGKKPSPFPWIMELFPDEFYWWMFALDYKDAKVPSVLWITNRLKTRGPLAPQVPWITDPAVFITDYQQNGTYGFYRCCGTTYFNVPAQPGNNKLTAYSLLGGTYKISLPWVSRDGLFEIIQFDDWKYDQIPPEQRDEWVTMGSARTLVGLPYMPSPPQTPSSMPS